MTTDGLVVWLCSQLDQDEDAAISAIQETSGAQWEPDDGGCCVVVSTSDSQRMTGDDGPLVAETRHWQSSEYIARHDPMFVLADVAAKRQVLDRCAEVLEMASDHHTVESCDEDDAVLAEAVVRTLAMAYAVRTGYRDEWRP